MSRFIKVLTCVNGASSPPMQVWINVDHLIIFSESVARIGPDYVETRVVYFDCVGVKGGMIVGTAEELLEKIAKADTK